MLNKECERLNTFAGPKNVLSVSIFNSFTSQTSVIPVKLQLYQSNFSFTSQTSVIPVKPRLYQSNLSFTSQTSVIPVKPQLYQSNLSYTSQTSVIPVMTEGLIGVDRT